MVVSHYSELYNAGGSQCVRIQICDKPLKDPLWHNISLLQYLIVNLLHFFYICNYLVFLPQSLIKSQISSSSLIYIMYIQGHPTDILYANVPNFVSWKLDDLWGHLRSFQGQLAAKHPVSLPASRSILAPSWQLASQPANFGSQLATCQPAGKWPHNGYLA